MKQEDINTLRDHRFVRTEEDLSIFESHLAEVAKSEPLSADDLSALFMLLEDDVGFIEVPWDVVHFIENHAVGDVVLAFASIVPHLARQAPEWTETIMARLLNDNQARILLQLSLRGNRDSQAAAWPILERLRHGSNRHLRDRAEEVVQNLSS